MNNFMIAQPKFCTALLMVTLALSSSLNAAEFAATLAWADRTALSLPISGQIKEVLVKPGQDVAAGSPLLALDSRPMDARVSEARAAVKALERRRVEAARETKRAEELYARTVLSNVELEKAHIDQARVDGEYQQAAARMQYAETERSYTPLKAPFAARILSVQARVGESVSATMHAPTLVEVARADVMDVVAALRAEQVRGVRLGEAVDVEVEGQRQRGEVIALESPREGGYRLVVRVPMRAGWVAGLEAKIFTP